MQINVTVDASKLEQWARELSVRGMRSAVRSAVDNGARAVRKIAVDIIAKDMEGASKTA